MLNLFLLFPVRAFELFNIMSQHYLSIFFIFSWDILSLHLYFSWCSLKISHFLEITSSSEENCSDLGSGSADCCWGITIFKTFQKTVLGKTHIHVHNTHIYIYTYFWVYINTSIPMQNSRIYSSFVPFPSSNLWHISSVRSSQSAWIQILRIGPKRSFRKVRVIMELTFLFLHS